MCRLSEKTLSRWMREEPFARAVQEMRREYVQYQMNSLVLSGKTAVRVLQQRLRDDTHPGAQVSAARAVLKYTQDTVHAGDTQARLTRLEQLLGRLVEVLADGTPAASLTVLLAGMQQMLPLPAVTETPALMSGDGGNA